MTHSTTRSLFFFFNDTATTEIYTLSLHDALPICRPSRNARAARAHRTRRGRARARAALPAFRARSDQLAAPAHLGGDRKSTRLNSSHDQISYAVFCLKKKKLLYQLLSPFTHMARL